MQPITPADYTGDGSTHTLASLLGIDACRWSQVTAVSVGSTAARVGDSTTDATHGFPVGSGAAEFAPPINEPFSGSYDLTKWYINVHTGDTVSLGAVI